MGGFYPINHSDELVTLTVSVLVPTEERPVDGDSLANPGLGTQPTDSQLIQACLLGDTQAFRPLYRRHQPRVRSVLARLGDPVALDDLVQEVFLRAWQGLPKLRQTHQFATWLYRIAWNVASDYRHKTAQQRSQREQLQQLLPTTMPSPDLMQLHYQDLVERGLTELSFDHRTVIVLHDLEALSQPEISEILDIPVGTVKSRLFHARQTLRQFLQKAGVQL
jgi:RNA polymerase sigma factor (sigma-70 family)